MQSKLLAAMTVIFTILAPAAFAQSVAASEPAGKFAVSETFKIGGDGRWDYPTIDTEHHLFLTRSTHTQIVDAASGKVIADIAGGRRLHGTAVATSAQRAFVTDGEAGKLLVIDLKTSTLAGEIEAADDADGAIYDAASDRVLVACGDSAALLLLDPKADLATAKVEKVDLDGKPEFLAADGKGHAYVCLNDKNLIAEVDLTAKKVTSRWPCGSGTGPTGLAIDPKLGRLFVGCRNQKLIVMSTIDGKVLSELPIGRGNDACGFDPGTGEAFASCGDGTVTVVKESETGRFAVEQTIATKNGARTMTIDPSNHKLYLPTADFAPAEPGKRPVPIANSFQVVVVSPVSRP